MSVRSKRFGVVLVLKRTRSQDFEGHVQPAYRSTEGTITIVEAAVSERG